MSASLVLREDRGPVVILTLNRPEKRNALSRALVAELGDTLSAVGISPQIRVVILTGAGPVFCSGMDLREAAEGGFSTEAERRAVDETRALGDLIQQVHTLPKPTIAVLNGDAYAGGAGLAVACDFLVAGATAQIGYPEIRRGLVAAIVMQDLVRQIGDRRARELLLTGAPIGAEEAHRWGLVNRLVPAGQAMAEALELARTLVAGGPIAQTTIKRLLDDATLRPRDLRGAAAITASVRTSDEAAEGIVAFLEKRPPAWDRPI